MVHLVDIKLGGVPDTLCVFPADASMRANKPEIGTYCPGIAGCVF